MNVAQLQLALGRLASPAAAEKPDLAGYEAQGEFWGQSGGPMPLAPGSDLSLGCRGLGGQGLAGGLPMVSGHWLMLGASVGSVPRLENV